MPDQRCPSCRAAFNVARAEDLPKNWAVLDFLQGAQGMPRALGRPPALPSAAKHNYSFFQRVQKTVFYPAFERVPKTVFYLAAGAAAAGGPIPPGVKPDCRHVVSAQTEDARCVLPPTSPTPPHPQHHNGFIYMTAHAHVAKGRVRVQDYDGPESAVVIGDGYEIAPGDASDIEVTNAYPWACLELFFSDGQRANTAMGLKNKIPERSLSHQMDIPRGMAPSFFKLKP